MVKTTNVKTIVYNWLRENGYDGLFNENAECSCDLNDLMCCGNAGIDLCVPAYKLDCKGCVCSCLDESNYMMSTDKDCADKEC